MVRSLTVSVRKAAAKEAEESAAAQAAAGKGGGAADADDVYSRVAKSLAMQRGAGIRERRFGASGRLV